MKPPRILRSLITHGPNLLPRSAYPADLTAQQRAHVDEHMQQKLPSIPSEPGVYVDRTGDRWELDDHGRWTDHKGEARGPEWQPLMGLFGPFTRSDESEQPDPA